MSWPWMVAAFDTPTLPIIMRSIMYTMPNEVLKRLEKSLNASKHLLLTSWIVSKLLLMNIS